MSLITSLPTPSYIDPSNISLPFIISLPQQPEFSDILTSYYTTIYKSVLSGTLLNVVSDIQSFFETYQLKFDYEISQIRKDKAEQLLSITNKHGTLSGRGFNHRLYKAVNELIYKEMNEVQALSIKYKEQFIKDFQKFITELNKLISQANSLYADIYKKDFRVTADAHVAWIDYVIAHYNALVERIVATASVQGMNAEVQAEIAKNQVRRQGGRLVGELAQAQAQVMIAQSEQQFADEMLRQSQQLSNYILSSDRLTYIIAEAQARAIAAQVELVNALVQAGNSYVSAMQDRVEVMSRSNSIADRGADIGSRLNRIASELADINKDILYSDYTASRSKVEAATSIAKANTNIIGATRQEAMGLKKFSAVRSLINRVNSLASDEVAIAKNAGAADAAMTIASSVSRYNDTVASFYLSAGRSAVETTDKLYRIETDLIHEYKRMEISAFARITASFIRSFS